MALEIKSHESDDRGCRGQGLCARATKYLVHECMQHHAASCRLVLASCSKLQAPHSSDTGSAAAGAIHHQRRPHTATTNAIAHTAAVRPHPHGLGKASSWPSFVRAAEAQIALRHMTGPIASPFGATLQDSSIPLYPIVSVGCVGHDVWGAENVADAVPPRHIMHMPYGNTLGRASHARSPTVRYALPREANGSRAAVLPCPPAEVSARGDEIRASSPATDRRRVSRPLHRIETGCCLQYIQQTFLARPRGAHGALQLPRPNRGNARSPHPPSLGHSCAWTFLGLARSPSSLRHRRHPLCCKPSPVLL